MFIILPLGDNPIGISQGNPYAGIIQVIPDVEIVTLNNNKP